MTKIVGIYKITNILNGKSYIGRSANIKKRWENHRCCNGDKNLPLYIDIKKYGKENFKFEILEECQKDYLIEKELYYINKFNTVKKGYNPTDITDNAFFHKDIQERIKETWKSKYSNNDDYLEKLGQRTKELWENKEYREKVTQAIRKQKASVPKKEKMPKSPKPKKIVIKRIIPQTIPMKIQSNTKEWKDNKSREIKEAWARGVYGEELIKKLREGNDKFHERFKTDSEYRESVIQKMKDNKPNSISIDMLNKETGEKIMDFPKIMDGAKWIRENTTYAKADYATINKVCKGNAKTAYGYKWRYSKERGD